MLLNKRFQYVLQKQLEPGCLGYFVCVGDGEALHVPIGVRHTMGGKGGHLATSFTDNLAESCGRLVGMFRISTRCIALVATALGIGNVSARRAQQRTLAVGTLQPRIRA